MKIAWIAVLLLASPLHADDDPAEAELKRFFEGQRVVVLLDLPATSDGFDVYPEREYPLDLGKMSDRTRRSGVALREGDRVPVTRIKLKDDLIEFQLAGGGFNTFKDGSGTVSAHITPKSSLERDLERQVRRGNRLAPQARAAARARRPSPRAGVPRPRGPRARRGDQRAAPTARPGPRPRHGLALQHPLREEGRAGGLQDARGRHAGARKVRGLPGPRPPAAPASRGPAVGAGRSAAPRACRASRRA